MTKEEHIKIHKKLHHSLDVLVADMIDQTRKLPSSTTVMELIEWSYEQTTNPTTKER